MLVVVCAFITLSIGGVSGWYMATRAVFHDIGGAVMLEDTAIVHADAGVHGSCSGTNAYDDIRTGAPVVVKDAKGTVLATGTLARSRYVADGSCNLIVVVKHVPDRPDYSIQIANRAPVTRSKARLDASDWNVFLTLGPGAS